MSRKFFRNSSREKKKSKIKRMSPLANLLAVGLGSCGARRCSVQPVPDLRCRPAAGWLVGRQLWPGHHPGRHPS